MKKKVIALLLAAAMVTGCMVGCGSGSSETSSSGSAESSAPAAESTADTAAASGDTEAAAAEESSGEKTQLTALFISHSLTQDLEDMEWLQEIEEEANVDIQWEQIRADWDTVKSTRLASGDIPDIMINAVNDADITQYQGLFLDMTSYISAETTPNIQAMFDEEPDTLILATNVDGNIYSLPKFQGKWPDTNTVMFINQQWLDNLGLEMPTTFSELKDVLIAFRDEDANGNGDPSDEIPFDFNAGTNNAWFNSAYSLTRLIGAMGIQLTDYGSDAYFVEDGQVKCYAVDERYKLFMEYMADLYAEGLINTNAITNDYSMFQSLSRGNENGDALVGVVFGWEETDKFGPTLYSQYEPVAPLDYDIDCEPGTYDTRWSNDYNVLNMAANRVVVNANSANPEAAMRFIDRFYDPTVSVEVLFGGITDGCIEQTGDNSFKVLDPLDPDTDSGTWKWTSTMADNGPMYIRRDTEIEFAQDMAYALEERTVYEETLAKASESDTYPQMFMKYSQEDQNTMALTQANINNIIDNQWSLWLSGQADIESTWDSYVQSVEAAGLSQVLEIRQAAFDAYLAGGSAE